MKKILFIDRDGTIIKEDPNNYQIDSIEKLFFYPRVIFFLSRIYEELDYEFVMVTNQDGLGSVNFPENKFWPIHNHIINILKYENIIFSSIHIDKTYIKDNLSTRKPGISMLLSYLDKSIYNIKESFVIGDRLTDIMLAKNLGCKSIWIKGNNNFENFTEEEKKYFYELYKKKLYKTISLKTNKWKDIYEYLKNKNKKIEIYKRNTLETNITISLSLYGNGINNIHTGIGFFDHLIEQISIHSLMDINLYAYGDLHVDEHHTIEDVGIALGNIFRKSLGDKIGIERYGFFILPMDDSLSKVVLDLCGRDQFNWNANFYREKIGDIPTEMFYHFFKSFSSSAKCNLHIISTGNNEHHKIESIFKCFAKAIKMAIQKNHNYILSSKGLL